MDAISLQVKFLFFLFLFMLVSLLSLGFLTISDHSFLEGVAP
jgi:hypothetical protein